MALLDYLVLVLYVFLVAGLGFYFSRRAGESTSAFINADRSLPWWLAGTSMIAGSFGADSPLHQSRKIRQTGLSGAWFYWAQIGYHIINSIVFSKLWRRSELTTPVEFYDIRYGGKARNVARTWAVMYNAFIEQSIFTALGLLGLIKIVEILLDLPASIGLLGLEVSPALLVALATVAVATAYSAASGVYGVVVTDLIEFIIAIGCSYVLMFLVYSDVGWAQGLEEGLTRLGGAAEGAIEMLPTWGLALSVYLFIQPFVLAYGQTAINQRYLAIQDERQAMFSGVWRVLNHFIFRGWPWYIAGLASLVLLANVSVDSELAYPMLIDEYMPVGLKGLMVAGFLAAFMSSIDTSIHTSTSIFVNDFYRSYVRPRATERHYVFVSRLSILAFTIMSVIIALMAGGILELLMLVMKMQAGIGLVMLLRWFWWRVNVWADLAAQVAAVPVALLFEHDARVFSALFGAVGPTDWSMALFGLSGLDDRYAVQFLLICATCTLIWVVVMFLTPPEPEAKLIQFYRRIRPYGFWGPIKAKCPGVKAADSLADDALLVGLGLLFCYASLFTMGALFLAKWSWLLVAAPGTALTGFVLIRKINSAAEQQEPSETNGAGPPQPTGDGALSDVEERRLSE